jgi:hypothetical protein
VTRQGKARHASMQQQQQQQKKKKKQELAIKN